MVEDKIFNSSYNTVDYGNDSGLQPQISVSPFVEDLYEENLSDDMDDVYTRKKLHEDMAKLYEDSSYYGKYGKSDKKIERADIFDIYYTFKEKLLESQEYTIAQVFCEIAEFFSLNYKTLYNDILTLEDKVKILDDLSEKYGLQKQFSESKRLF